MREQPYSTLYQLIQIRLTLMDPKTGSPDKKHKDPLEINGANIQNLELNMEAYGFTGGCTLLPLYFEHKTLKDLLPFLQTEQPVKIELMVQQKLQLEDENKKNIKQQLLLSGFLNQNNPMTLKMDQFPFKWNPKTNKVEMREFSNQLQFSFCDPLAYWGKQIGVRKVFVDKSYTEVMADIFKPLVSKKLFELKVDPDLKEYKEKRRLIFAATEGESSLHDYLIFILKSYPARLRFDYEILQEKDPKSPTFPEQEPKEFSKVAWPKFKDVTYQIEALDAKPKEESKIEMKAMDWMSLALSELKVIHKSQTGYQTSNTYVKSSGETTQKEERGFCTSILPISEAVKDKADKESKHLLKQTMLRQTPCQQLETVFSNLPLFATHLFPYGKLDFQLPMLDEKSKLTPLPLFRKEKTNLMSSTWRFVLATQGSKLPISKELLGNHQTVRHTIGYAGCLMDESKQKEHQMLPEVPALPCYFMTEGLIVDASDGKKKEDKAPQYLHKVEKNKSKVLAGLSMDNLAKDTKCYWVKIPEFKELKPCQVKAMPNLLGSAQMRTPLKNDTHVSLACYPEYIEIVGVLDFNFDEQVQDSQRKEGMYLGGKQEASMTMTTDENGKNREFRFGASV